jgi:predicted Zn-dependent protease
MAALSGGNQPPAFISSHPSNEKRIEDLTAYIPVARRYAATHPMNP